MKSKNSFFNGTIFRRALRRGWLLWCVYLAALLVFLLGQLRFDADVENLQYVANGDLLVLHWRHLVLTTFAMGALSAMCVFSHLYSQRQTALMNSLPVTRQAVYRSCFAAGLLPLLAADVLAVLVVAAAEAGAGVLNMSLLLYTLALLVMMNIGFYGFAALCAMLTGSIFILPLVYLVLGVVAAAVQLVIQGLFSTLLFGYYPVLLSLYLLSPLGWLISSLPLGVLDNGFIIYGNLVIYLGIWCAAGLAFSLLGLWLHKRRAMETTGDVVAVRALRPVFRYCMAFGCALVFPLLYPIASVNDVPYEGGAATTVMTALALLGCAVGYYGSEMMMKKTVHVFQRKLTGFLAAGVIVLAAMLCIAGDITGYETYVPAAEEIAAVHIDAGGAIADFFDLEDISLATALHSEIISNKPYHDSAAGQLHDNASATLFLTYQLTDGSTVMREYGLYDPEQFEELSGEIAALSALMNTLQAFDAQKLTMPITYETLLYCQISHIDADDPIYDESGGEIVYNYTGVSLSAEQTASLYEAIEKDLDAGLIGQFFLLPQDSGIETDIYIDFTVMDNTLSPRSFEHANFTVTTASENTLLWLKDNLGIEPAETG